MYEEFKVPLGATWIVKDDSIIIKKEEIPFSDINYLNEVFKANKLVNGVYELGVKGKKYNLVFTNKDKERALDTLNFLREKINCLAENRTNYEINDCDNTLLTAKGMYSYAKENGFGTGFTKGLGEKHFAVLEKNLLKDEIPVMTFIGLHNYTGGTNHDGNFAYALTNKRLIIGQWKLIGENFQSIKIQNINDVTFTSGILFGVLTIDSLKETLNVALDKISAQRINEAFHEEFDKFSRTKNEANIANNQNTNSVADEIRKYKQLLDEEIITEEEFQSLKKKLLGI